MKSTFVLVVIVSISVGLIRNVAAEDSDSVAGPIQIIRPVNHTLQLQLEDLKPILEADDIKDRHVVVVSIAGAYRKGKSFLLNFFIRYLDAQYKKHDVTDWMGENMNNSVVSGFKWRGGKKIETTGIWMWSDVYTHDFDNGDKVAIIVLDTQGIFDGRSNVQDYTQTFALSMMLSSVQCYNIKEQIQGDSLQYLDLFTEYARLALEQLEEKPFQSLLFIIRDWPFPYENSYGWQDEKLINDLMNGDEEQTTETKELVKRIRSSFNKIDAFLMPHPGMAVSRQQNFTGDLKQIDPSFKKYVKELVSTLFDPKNLVVKEIDGRKVRARDLLKYVQTYSNIFNGGTLPSPKTVIDAIAETSILILYNDSLSLYTESMRDSFDKVHPYFKESELLDIHTKAKNESFEMFQNKRKLGTDELKSTYLQKLDNAIEIKFQAYQKENNNTRNIFVEKANLYNGKIIAEIRMVFERKILEKTSNEDLEMTAKELNALFSKAKQCALAEFDAKKMGDSEVTAEIRRNFKQDLEAYQSKVAEKWTVSFKKYGKLTITFVEATAASHADGSRCDMASPCDSYIKLFIDNKMVYQTKTIWDKKHLVFNETYTTPDNINKKAPITIQLWDFDNLSSHDPILTWDTSVKELLKTKIKHGHGENKIKIRASWKEKK
ncbi:atlastin-like [Contarinia nasturtii]|uniref:atlastin-like n=1 Tax=Contarinia nasturtii TaxID=265458 RepID=UPI0012D3A05F|nr:atlastin-like [Contarinia nasturtii]XP_031634117.1 atlastin-like [Contarinia nasturtii]